MKIHLTNHISNISSHERTIDTPLQQSKAQDHSTQAIQVDMEAEKGKVRTSVEKMNDFIEPLITDLKFVFHEDLHEYYVTVVNPLTNEVIREIPPKKMLDIYAAMTEYIGLLVDKKI